MQNETMGKHPVRPDVAENVVAYVRDLLTRGDFKPGDRLPAERELAQQIGVSRPSVRAGLQTLPATAPSRWAMRTTIRRRKRGMNSWPSSQLFEERESWRRPQLSALCAGK